MKYRFIENHSSEFSVKKMCEVFQVSRSAFYEWRQGHDSHRQKDDVTLLALIRAIFSDSRQTYGHRRIKRVLNKQYHRSVSNQRVRRLMAEAGLVPVQTRRFKATTNSKHNLPVAPNLLEQNFTAAKPGEKWCGDITYIATAEGWLYLATVIDLYSRRVVGWAVGPRMTKDLVIRAFRQALQHGDPQPGLIFHSDRGSQYASYAFQDLLRGHNVRQSMSKKGDCYDNACAESFFATLKKELIHRCRFQTRAEASLKTLDYILWYNNKRIHSRLGGCAPSEYEHLYYRKPTSQVA